jgi:hypothetical protein
MQQQATLIAGSVAIVILLIVAAVHVYWAAGGKAGKGAVPAANGRPVIKPSTFGTALVAVALCAMAALLALRIGWLDQPALPGNGVVVQIGTWLMAAVFALRAIGDFRYVGFFKRIRDGAFARLDTLVYSPLCAFLALLIGISAST